MISSEIDIKVSVSDEDIIEEELFLISSSSVKRKVKTFSLKFPVF